MSDFDIEGARKRVRALLREKRIGKLYHLTVPLIAHIGALVTIFAAWFLRTGSLSFHVSDWKDWGIASFLVFVAISGSILIVREFSSGDSFVVRRAELADLIAVARADAEVSAINVGGDLSWLADDFEALKRLKESKPDLTLKIYCHPSSASPQTSQLMETLSNSGIEFISYPPAIKPSIKCLLIDKEHPDSCRVYSYMRHGEFLVGQRREMQEFLWRGFGPKSHLVIEAMTALGSVIETAQVQPIRVGISGLNNVGKTILSNRLREFLIGKLNVKLYPDAFRVIGGGTTLDDNFLILFSQLANEAERKADVLIFDRTIVDNLCFLRMRTGKDERIYRSLAPIVAEKIKNYDLIIDVRTDTNADIKETRFVTAAERRLVRVFLNEFFSTFGVEKEDVKLSSDNFKSDVNAAADRIGKQVMSIYRNRRLAN